MDKHKVTLTSSQMLTICLCVAVISLLSAIGIGYGWGASQTIARLAAEEPTPPAAPATASAPATPPPALRPPPTEFSGFGPPVMRALIYQPSFDGPHRGLLGQYYYTVYAVVRNLQPGRGDIKVEAQLIRDGQIIGSATGYAIDVPPSSAKPVKVNVDVPDGQAPPTHCFVVPR